MLHVCFPARIILILHSCRYVQSLYDENPTGLQFFLLDPLLFKNNYDPSSGQLLAFFYPTAAVLDPDTRDRSSEMCRWIVDVLLSPLHVERKLYFLACATSIDCVSHSEDPAPVRVSLKYFILTHST